MSIFLERLSMWNMLICTEQVQYKNTKHMHIRHPKQHVFKQSCSDIQLSSKDRLKKKKKKREVPTKPKFMFLQLFCIYKAPFSLIA